MEVIWTGTWSLIQGDFTLKGHTYIWMISIYGLAVFLEPVHDYIRNKNILFRGLLWTIIIYIIEYSTGWVLYHLIGSCPWNYTDTNMALNGFIRFDFAPAWFVAGLLFERMHDFLDSILIKS